MANADRVIAICEAEWDAHKSDCGGFVRTCPKIIESTFERVEYGFTTEFSYHMLWW